ncbi:MAG: hypothetical protein KIT84_42340 [Labilithrix sp.]|nr:hypothetical protein [Labilithrix sp.]MCW5817716.1 hypothetical protein [Labilithrix sp.]
MRRSAIALLPFAVCAGLACNAITGEHERVLAAEVDDERDGGDGRPDTGSPPGTEEDTGAPPVTEPDAGDAGPTTQTVTLGTNWQSPNGATFTITGGGTKIATVTAPKYHGMLLPATPPTTAKDYKVKARILANEQHEYGIFVRGRGAGDTFQAIVLSSRISNAATENRPFMATITVAEDNPDVANGAEATPYAFAAGKVWIFEVEAKGEKVDGTIYREDDPGGVRRAMTLTDKTPAGERGSGVGFYGYGAANAILLEMTITF